MNREQFSQTVTETSVNVVASQVESVRTKDITKTAVRLYDGRSIGIAGALGACDPAALESRAAEALKHAIEYPFEPADGGARHEQTASEVPSPEEFVGEVAALLSDLRSGFPEFLFSNKINLTRTSTALGNDRGLDYSYTSNVVSVELLCKPRKSVKDIDTFVGYSGARYSRQALLGMAQASLPPYLTEVPVEPGEYPVCFFADDMECSVKFLHELSGLIFGSGGSLFSGKTGQRLFSNEFTLLQSRADADEVYRPFFDVEGLTNPDDRVALISEGVIKMPYTNRKYARKFNLPLTGAAGGEYDAVPDMDRPVLVFQSSDKSIAELLDGRRAILVYIAAGGDYTPDGRYASPVQTAYVFDGERVVGKAPELAISSHLYKMYGEDFIGVSRDNLYRDIPTKLLVTKMQVSEG